VAKALRLMQRRFVQKGKIGWDGVEREGYVPGDSSRVVRNTLVGERKEGPADPGPAIEVRYFEVPPGAATRLEKHEHEHFVIVGEGVGHAIVGTEVREVRKHDVVYVGALEPHQFVNRGNETFGFFCMVNAHRDPGRAIDETELAALERSSAASYVDREVIPKPR
jgi:quercetin dioxygenase-like cupin family protein